MSSIGRLTFWRFVLLTSVLLVPPTAADIVRTAETMHVVSVLHSEWAFALIGLALAGLCAASLLTLTWTKHQGKVLHSLEFPDRMGRAWRMPALALLPILIVGFAIVTLHPYWAARLNRPWTIIGVAWGAALATMVCLRLSWRHLSWPASLGIAALLAAAAFRSASFIPAITNYPFSLGWSETSRYYDASLLFATRIYGERLPLAVLHPTLHFLLAIPFLFGTLPIGVHRAWQVVLRLGLTALTGVSLVRRLGLKDPAIAWLAGLWAFLFLFQGPVYLHLLVPVLVMLWGFSARNPARSLVAVLIASAWAGMSRINWFPVPGMLAAAMYFLEVPVRGRDRQVVRYLAWPVVWIVLGLLTAFSSQALYITASGCTDRSQFYTSLSSALLWYRLLPNATNPSGILPMVLVVSLPVGLAMGWAFHSHRLAWHPLRLLGLGMILAVLLLGGLVVSVKIGAGGDLHNLDAFLVCLMLVGACTVSGRYASEDDRPSTAVTLPWPVAVLVLAAPAVLALRSGRPMISYDHAAADRAVQQIQARVSEAVEHGGEVLFITQRQLVTVGLVQGVPMVPDYEIEILMEMAMAGNPRYLSRFYSDLQLRRFDLIITNTLYAGYRGSEVNWGEENDVWVKRVALPLLCEYQTEMVVPEANVAFLVPRPGPGHCP